MQPEAVVAKGEETWDWEGVDWLGADSMSEVDRLIQAWGSLQSKRLRRRAVKYERSDNSQLIQVPIRGANVEVLMRGS